MPHRPNPIPRLNNPQYASTSLNSSQSASSTVQNAPHSGTTNSLRRDLNTVPPRHRGHSFSGATSPSIVNQDGNIPNRGERMGGGSQRALPPPRFQRKQRPPRVQNILAGPDNIDRTLGTLTFGPATNWGVGTQSVVSLPMAAVNAASSAVALPASLTPNIVPFSNSTFNAPTGDHSSGISTRGFARTGVGSIPHTTNTSPLHLSFGKSGSLPHSTSLPNPPAHLVSEIFFSLYLGSVQTTRSNAYTSLRQLCVAPPREDPAVGLCAPSVLAPYFASTLEAVNDGYIAENSMDEPHFSTPSISAIQPLSRTITPPKGDPVPPTSLKSELNDQRSIPNLTHTAYSSPLTYHVPEKPSPSTPALHSAHNIKSLDCQDVISHPPHVSRLEYEHGLIGADEDGLQAPDEVLVHPSNGAGLEEWEEFVEALAAGVVEDEERLFVSPPLAPGPVVRVSPPSRGPNPSPSAIPTGFVESTALTRTPRGRPISTLGAHAHCIPPYVPRLRSRSRSPSPTLSGNGSCESTGSMGSGSLPGLGSFGSGSTGGSRLSLQSTLSSRPPNIFSNNASMASLASRSTISSGRSLRTVDSHGSLRSSTSGAFPGTLLGGSSIWAMDKEEAGAGAGIGTVGVAGGSTLSLVPEEGNGFGLPKGAAPALEPFGAFEPTPRRKDRTVIGFSNTTYVNLPYPAGHANEPNSFVNLPKKTARSAFHARAPSEVSDNPFASVEAISGSPPSSPPHKPSALSPAPQHVPLIPIADSFVSRKGGTSAIQSKQHSTAVGSSLSSNAKAFIPRSSITQNAQFSENTDHVPGRMAIGKVDDVFVGATGIIGAIV